MGKKFLLCIFMFLCLRSQEVFAGDIKDQVKNNELSAVSATVSLCGEMDCFFEEELSCKEKCGCDKLIPYGFNNTTGQCELNLKKLMIKLAQKYKTQEKNRRRTESIFQGIMVSGIIVITWASVCLLSVCYYCCRIKYMDHQLRNSIKDVAKKLHTHQMANKRCKKNKKDEFTTYEPTAKAASSNI